LVPAKDSHADQRTRMIDRHDVSGFFCYRVTQYEQYQTLPIVYSGPDPISQFYDHVISESHLIDQSVSDHVPMKPLASQQEAEFRTATVCRNCDEPFSSHNYKVRHHDHLSGQFLFAAFNNCNLQLKPTKCRPPGASARLQVPAKTLSFYPFYFTTEKYDFHFILKHIGRKFVSRRDKYDKISFDNVSK